MLTLYGFLRSRSNRPHWALEELEVPYTFVQLDFNAGDHRSEKFLALNPGGKVPVLVDGDFVLTESAAICTYLGDRFPEKGMTPAPATRERALYDQWMLFIQSELEQPLWSKGKHSFALPEDYRIPAMLDTALYEFQRPLQITADALGERQWMIGDRLTMVDLLLAHTLRWAVNFKFPVEQQNLLDFLERMEQRPAYQRLKNVATTPFVR